MFGDIPAARSSSWPADTWAVREGRWAQVATDGPPARARAAMAYDSRRRQIVLFGGVSAPGPNQAQTFLDDTWIWDGRQWRKVPVTGPRGGYAHGMVFDERAGVVLFTAATPLIKGAPLNDMWQWTRSRWAMEIPSDGSDARPSLPTRHGYDRARQRTVLAGGSGAASDTWEWDGRAWRQAAN